jgi:hypothetical protein
MKLVFFNIRILLLIFLITISFESCKKKNNNTVSVKEVNFEPKSAFEAIEMGKAKNQYLFIVIFEKRNELFISMQKVINNFKDNVSKENLLVYEADISNPKNNELLSKYKINISQLPFLFVFAPNGAITSGFPNSVNEQQVAKAIVPEFMMDLLKSMQEGKITLLMLQNEKTKFNKESQKAADDFSNDKSVKGFVTIVKEDPKNNELDEFLNICKLNKNIAESTIVFIIPPGQIVGTYPGKTTKDVLLAALKSCSSGSCGPQGCGPVN